MLSVLKGCWCYALGLPGHSLGEGGASWLWARCFLEAAQEWWKEYKISSEPCRGKKASIYQTVVSTHEYSIKSALKVSLAFPANRNFSEYHMQ